MGTIMHRVNYFLDTEFISKGSYFSLISIGVVCEDSRELYFQNKDCDFTKASKWVEKHVFPHLAYFDNGKINYPITFQSDIDKYEKVWKTEREIAQELMKFTDCGNAPSQFWGYYADWDWILVNQLFGGMLTIPSPWNQCCYDLRQFLDSKGLAHIVQPQSSLHHALLDARWIKETYYEHL